MQLLCRPKADFALDVVAADVLIGSFGFDLDLPPETAAATIYRGDAGKRFPISQKSPPDSVRGIRAGKKERPRARWTANRAEHRARERRHSFSRWFCHVARARARSGAESRSASAPRN